MSDKGKLAAKLVASVEEEIGQEVLILRERIRAALEYMEHVKRPNQHTLDHIRRYLAGEYDNH